MQLRLHTAAAATAAVVAAAVRCNKQITAHKADTFVTLSKRVFQLVHHVLIKIICFIIILAFLLLVLVFIIDIILVGCLLGPADCWAVSICWWYVVRGRYFHGVACLQGGFKTSALCCSCVHSPALL